MKVQVFVTSSALLLCIWLTACFLRVVPLETYPSEPMNSRVSDVGKAEEIIAGKGDDRDSDIVVGH
jgi:hypothetical protein